MAATVQAINPNWTSLGVTISAANCASVAISCSGEVFWDPGTSNGGGESSPYGVPEPQNYPANTSITGNFYGCAILAVPSGTIPQADPSNGGIQYTNGGGYWVGGFAIQGGSVVSNSWSWATITAAAGTSGPFDLYAIENDDVPSNNSGSYSLTTTVTGPASPPGSFTLSGSYSLNPSGCVVSILLSWTASSGAETYNLWRNGVEIATGLTGATYTDTTGVVGVTYTYYAVAVNAQGSTDSNSVAIDPLTLLTTPVVSVCQPCCDSSGWKSVVVSWTAVTTTEGSITGYTVTRNDGLTIAVGPAVLSITDTMVDFETDYTYTVVANFGCWTSPPGMVAIRVVGWANAAAPATTYAGSAAPSTTWGGSSASPATWAKGGCNCGCD